LTSPLIRERAFIMGKGMQPKKGYNQKKYDSNYDLIDWSKTRKPKETKK